MSEQICINIGVFNSNMTELRGSVNKLATAYMSTGESLDKTNIKPFLNDLENAIRALELLKEYQQLFTSDLSVIEDVANKIREKDEELSTQQTTSSGPQPARV